MDIGDEGDVIASPEQVRELAAQVAANRAELDSLRVAAEEANARAVAAQELAEQQRRSIAAVEARARMNREMITDLQTEGLVSTSRAAQLEQALDSARTIGAAMGIIMTSLKVVEGDAFEALRRTSQMVNRRVRDIAADIVETGDLSGLVTRHMDPQ